MKTVNVVAAVICDNLNRKNKVFAPKRRIAKIIGGEVDVKA